MGVIWRTFKLLLPAVIPSWRFFDFIAPSPRVQFALLESRTSSASHWQEYRPKPAHISFASMLRRMIWNPYWNASLFVVSCSERLLINPTPHSENEIFMRILADLNADSSISRKQYSAIQFRLLLVSREGQQLTEEVVFYSDIRSLPAQEEP